MEKISEDRHPPEYLVLTGLRDVTQFREEENFIARIAYVDPITKTLWIHSNSIVITADGGEHAR